jgi:hypothetical protein
MSGLSLGLAFGLAAAGGIGAAALHVMGNFATGLVGVFARDPRLTKPQGNLAVSAFTGALIGGAVGYGAGWAIEKISEPPKPAPIVQNGDCDSVDQREGSIVIRRNENGRTVCTVLNINGLVPR